MISSRHASEIVTKTDLLKAMEIALKMNLSNLLKWTIQKRKQTKCPEKRFRIKVATSFAHASCV